IEIEFEVIVTEFRRNAPPEGQGAGAVGHGCLHPTLLEISNRSASAGIDSVMRDGGLAGPKAVAASSPTQVRRVQGIASGHRGTVRKEANLVHPAAILAGTGGGVLAVTPAHDMIAGGNGISHLLPIHLAVNGVTLHRTVNRELESVPEELRGNLPPKTQLAGSVGNGRFQPRLLVIGNDHALSRIGSVMSGEQLALPARITASAPDKTGGVQSSRQADSVHNGQRRLRTVR